MLRSANPACYRIATIGFQFPLLSRSLKGGVDHGGGVLLHARDHVAVEIERYPHLAVAQTFACDFRVNTVGEQMCGMGVSQIMEPEAGQL